jgi:hypothetical protein
MFALRRNRNRGSNIRVGVDTVVDVHLQNRKTGRCESLAVTITLAMTSAFFTGFLVGIWFVVR